MVGPQGPIGFDRDNGSIGVDGEKGDTGPPGFRGMLNLFLRNTQPECIKNLMTNCTSYRICCKFFLNIPRNCFFSESI